MARMGTRRLAPRVRIDLVLVDKGVLESREKAARHILAGDVFVDGQRVDKAGALVSTTATIEVRAREPYVSRGGEKLVHALDSFQAKIPGRVCMDVGASTGGFTDCLLQRLARYAVLRGWHVLGVTASPLRGPKGNHEFFLHFSTHGRTASDLESLISRSVEALA